MYLGGLSVLLEWPSKEIVLDTLNSCRNWFAKWMVDIQHWNENIEGVPVHDWNSLKNPYLASRWGIVLIAENFSFDALLSAKK